jgi:diguanylate cyclase (GGDEF)-like protein
MNFSGAPALVIDEAAFRSYRIQTIFGVNNLTYRAVALLLVLFNGWDWYLDPVHAPQALAIRLAGAAVIIASGLVHGHLQRPALAPWFAKLRLLATATSISWALAVLDGGFVFGLSGLVIAFLGSSYVAIDRRDVFVLFLPALAAAVLTMLLCGLERFVFFNASIFLGLTLVIGWMLAVVLENSYRLAFHLEQALLRESRTDALTGAHNRRAMEEQARQLLPGVQRSGRPLSALMIDIDHFKRINDEHGHPVGDRAIRAVASCCQALLRGADRFGRWGGEEFLVLLPDAGIEQAIGTAERIREAVAGLEIEGAAGALRPTVSIGVASLAGVRDVDADWQSLVKAADEALYRAKSGGRNRVERAAEGILRA